MMLPGFSLHRASETSVEMKEKKDSPTSLYLLYGLIFGV
jgi:hypothetical protein